jgi:hypothetical protein
MNRVTHFEIPADNPEKSMKFYGDLFGWQFSKWGEKDYWLIATGEGRGIDGGLMAKSHPQQPATNVIDVENIDEMCAKIEGAGGQIVVPKMPIPTVGHLAYFKDPDENIFGVMQMDPTAS